MTVPLSAKQLVDRLWSYCHVLRHDGVSTIDYVEQLYVPASVSGRRAAADDGAAARATAHWIERVREAWPRVRVEHVDAQGVHQEPQIGDELGISAYVDLGPLSPEDVTATELAGEPITAKLTEAPGNGAAIGGLKVTTESAWFAARPSGTEDVYKIYAESFRGPEHLAQVQADAKAVVDAALGG